MLIIDIPNQILKLYLNKKIRKENARTRVIYLDMLKPKYNVGSPSNLVIFRKSLAFSLLILKLRIAKVKVI